MVTKDYIHSVCKDGNIEDVKYLIEKEALQNISIFVNQELRDNWKLIDFLKDIKEQKFMLFLKNIKTN